MRLAYWFDFEACGKIDDKLSANDLKDMFSDITFEDCKPFPTCETCDERTLGWCGLLDIAIPNTTFFCACHSQLINPDDGGNK